jgi:hypothetical protein
MKKFAPLVIAIVIAFSYLLPRGTTFLSELLRIELPTTPTILILFPFMSILPLLIAFIGGKYIKDTRLVFMACFAGILGAWLVDRFLIYLSAVLKGMSFKASLIFSLDKVINALASATGIGILGAGSNFMEKEGPYNRYGIAIMFVGLLIWFSVFIGGIVRWLNLLIRY